MQLQSNAPSPGSFFTDVTSGDELWTAEFLNERFPQPVTPLGWSLLREPFERLALREPLAFIGHPEAGRLSRTRLYRGHPYLNVAAFASLYRLLPDRLLPEDAARFFPDGQAALRRTARYPRSWSEPRLWAPMVGAAVAEAGNLSPWHNSRHWQWQRANLLAALARERARLDSATDEAGLWAGVTRLGELSRQLLAVHRWSLTHADLWYSVLRRLAHAWFGTDWQAQVAALVRGAERVSLALDADLHALARLAASLPGACAALDQARDQADLSARLTGIAGGQELVAQIALFLGRYGHRSHSLDLYQPPFAEAPKQVYELILALGESAAGGAAGPSVSPRLHGASGWVLERVRRLAVTYLALREEQRFVWQRILALQRRALLRLGERLQQRERLGSADDLFFLTVDEVEALVRHVGTGVAGRLATERRREWQALVAAEAAGDVAPGFLRGDLPLEEARLEDVPVLRGTPVSAGAAEGCVRVVRDAAQLPSLVHGEVLVAVGVDPGWTPVFAKIAALVTESGGQLSHPAVVAREYHLPAVLAVPGATRRLRTGERVRVDGTDGTVTRLGVTAGMGAQTQGG